MSAEVGNNNPYKDYLTTGSAGQILGVSPPRVHEFFDRGEFPTGIIVAGYKFMKEIEVLEFKQRREEQKRLEELKKLAEQRLKPP